jgi:subtilisin family serine protease
MTVAARDVLGGSPKVPLIRRAVVTVLTVSVAALLPGPVSAETPEASGWEAPTPSVDQDAARVVDAGPQDVPSEVVVTRRTDDGPVFETVGVDSRAEAVDVVEDAQDEASTIAVSVPQRTAPMLSNDSYRSKQWGLTALAGESAWTYATGSGVRVAVLDSGVDDDHPDLVGNLTEGYNAFDGSTATDDRFGHGTHVAGIVAATSGNKRGVAGLASRATIVPVKVLADAGWGSTTEIARGLVWAADHDVAVANLSVGAQVDDPALGVAVEYALARGVTLVASAGNSGCPSSTTYPASYPGVIAVASTSDARGTRSSFSSCGSWVDLAAPGESIYSTRQGGTYVYMSGTSMAAPQVAATAALLDQRLGHRASPAELAALMQGTATDRGTAGRDNAYGHGVVNPVAALKRASGWVALTVPTTSVVAGSGINVTGRLTTRDGRARAGEQVVLTWTSAGESRSSTLTTDGSGAFAKRFWPTSASTFAVSAPATTRSTSASTSASYAKVQPRWTFARSGRSVTLKLQDRRGQYVALEKKVDGKWRTSSRVTARERWAFTTGRGTWRVHSYGHAGLTDRYTAAWTIR